MNRPTLRALALLTLTTILVALVGAMMLTGITDGPGGTERVVGALFVVVGFFVLVAGLSLAPSDPEVEPGRVLRDPLPPDGYLDDDGAYIDGTGQVVRAVHKPLHCSTREHCTIHRPSDHDMRSWPTRWRPLAYHMERICPHGTGHPDPDHLAWALEEEQSGRREPGFARAEGLHGCDGCCAAPPEAPEETSARLLQYRHNHMMREAFDEACRASVELDLGPNAPRTVEGESLAGKYSAIQERNNANGST